MSLSTETCSKDHMCFECHLESTLDLDTRGIQWDSLEMVIDHTLIHTHMRTWKSV